MREKNTEIKTKFQEDGQMLVKKRESVSSPPASSAQNFYKLIYQEREKTQK